MDIFKKTIRKHFYIALVFLLAGMLFGFLYSLNLLGYIVPSQMLRPDNVRAVHISLMLYGFIPLMLSYLPFLLLYKDLGFHAGALRSLEIYSFIWYAFLFVMVISLLMGVRRGLAFYDFHYSLNFILAIAGIFYLRGLYLYIQRYKQKPLWVKISIAIVIIAPFALLFLMNPLFGQVEATVSGPHGDNTLGMSLALLPLYYLVFKLVANDEFKARWPMLWMIPAFFYGISVLHRLFIGPLSYGQEWFFQWLSLLYIPLLIRWYQDAVIPASTKRLLLISIVAFLFVDIEGNILFIESIRWIFHRNDLVIAHAHIAMGVGVLFLALTICSTVIPQLHARKFIVLYLFGMLGIWVVLSLNGFVEAGYFSLNTKVLWMLRSLFGLFIIFSFFYLIVVPLKFSDIALYNFAGLLFDGFGGVLLILLGDYLFSYVGADFPGKYIYVVFTFMMGTGLLHLLALTYPVSEQVLTFATAMIRLMVSGMFWSLFLSGKLGVMALMVGCFDFVYALIFMVWFYRPVYVEK